MAFVTRRAPWALLAILLLGLALRVYNVSGNPPELIVDELDLYNSARSFALTGHDIDGSRLPFLWCSFTRNPPMYAIAGYLSSLFFGNGPFGLRFPAVIFGLITIALMYFIALELTRRRDIALIAALLTATQPIFILFSRVGWEPASELPFLLGGLYFWLRAFRRLDRPEDAAVLLRWPELLAGAALFGLSAYTYMAAWFYAVMLGGAILVLNARRLRGRTQLVRVAAAVIVGCLIASPALWMWFGDPYTFSRTGKISTFHDGLNLANLLTFVANYFSQFRWSYLVTTGDPSGGATWKYMAGFGAFYWWLVPLALIGAACSFRYMSPRWAAVWTLLWLVFYPLGGALTNEAVPNAPRTLAGAPVFSVLAAIGLIALFDVVRWSLAGPLRTRVQVGLSIVCAANLVLSLVLFSVFYQTRYPRLYPLAWDSGTRSTFAVLRAQVPSYRRLCFSVRPSWYTAETFFRYYLADRPIKTFENIALAECFLPGTLLVTDGPLGRPGFATIATVREIGGGAFATIAGRP
jgi:4-amino-4-deoxy-L-arabinose transferase-like glycosyltransferase